MQLIREAKIYPSKTQLDILERLLEESRKLYNQCLEMKIKEYKENNKTLSRFDLQKKVKGYGDMPATLRQMVVYRLNNAYDQFFRRGGFPRFKSYGRYRSIPLRQYGTDYKIDGNYLKTWKKYGLARIKSRGLQTITNPKNARLVKRASGWYLQIIDEVVEIKPKRVKNAVGIDFGLKHFVVDTDGNKIKPPKYFRKTEKKLAIQQRLLSKKKKGGKNRNKARQIVARTHEKIANQRKDFLHKLSYKYASSYDLVCIEDLNIKGMGRNKHLAKSISDASWGIFANMASYKLKMLGGHLVKVNPRFTTQKCSECGELIQKSLSVRTHICTSCGYVVDRDENASRNILFLGLDKATGEGISIENPMNQEPHTL
ncbi:MAG: RNA-guided endonuclease TnpB family protein [bacterium]